MANVASGRENNTLLTAALTYANYGWSVFPCRVGESPDDPKDKAPYTVRGLLDATRDERQIRAWWAEHPDAAIGVACGASNLVVLDYDPRHDLDSAGWQRLKSLLNGHDTRQAETGRGGLHFYFRSPPGDAVRNSAGALGSGVDIRGDGGYVLAPPSLNAVGPYVWLNNEKIQPLPVSIPAALAVASPVKDRISRERADATTAIPDGRRHQTLMSMAGTMRWRGMSPLAIEKAILAENEEHCEPPLPEEEALRMARDAGNFEAGSLVYPPVAPDSKPEAVVTGKDSVEVRVTLADTTRATFTFTDMRKTAKGLTCHMSLTFFGIGYPYQQRIDLDSSSQRTELRRELDKDHVSDRRWGVALNAVWSLARDTYLSIDRSVAVDEIPLEATDRFLVDPLLVAEGTTIFFGDGSSSKSYLAQALGVSMVTGLPFAGSYAVPQMNVMYIDYETGAKTFRLRMDRICQGLGISTIGEAHGFRYWKADGEPLVDIAGAIRRSCDEHGIGWIIIDSAMPATGGAVEESEPAGGLFRGIDIIGRPCDLIAHITKSSNSEATKKPFGSTFFHNLARRTWFVAKQQEEDEDHITVACYCRKVNDGRHPRPVGFRLNFEGDYGPVRIATADPSGSPELAQHGSVASQLWAVLDQPLTLKEISEVTGIKQDTARVTMKRQAERFRESAQVNSQKAGRPAMVWSRIRSSDQQEANPF